MKKTISKIIIGLAVCIALGLLVSLVIIPAVKYGKADSLFKAGQYEEAVSAFKELRQYKDSPARVKEAEEAIKERDYSMAEELLAKNDFKGALKGFAALRNYKDSEARKEEILSEHRDLSVYIARAGDTVVFGSYEQDNDTSNGKEAIEWLVLDKKGNRILLVSKYALDNQTYYQRKDDVTWAKCELRTWLNETFLKEAFSDKERRMISITEVVQDEKVKNPTPFNRSDNSRDRVFVLSVTNANKYFHSDSERLCQPTAYARAQGAYMDPEKGSCWWWLRATVGDFDSYTPAIVDPNGDVRFYGFDVRSDDIQSPVRPAIWVEIE